jgi:hypothetical protein
VIRKAIGWLLSWSLYWLGDLCSKPMGKWNCCAFLFPLYNNLMKLSIDWQEWGGAGPWSKPETDEAA